MIALEIPTALEFPTDAAIVAAPIRKLCLLKVVTSTPVRDKTR